MSGSAPGVSRAKWTNFDRRLGDALEKLRLLPRESSAPEPPPEGGFVGMETGPVVNGPIGNEADRCGCDKPGKEVITLLKAEPAGATAGTDTGSSLIPQFSNPGIMAERSAA